MVHDLPGTTRDSIDTLVESEDGAIRYVDTAGMRRRSRIDEPTEYYGLVRALESVDRADAALLVIDATAGVTHQDQRLGERIDAAGTAVVIVLNKWDLVTDAEETPPGRGRRRRPARVPRLRAGAEGLRAVSGKNVVRVLPALRQAEEAYHTRIPTASLNRLAAGGPDAAPAAARAPAPTARSSTRPRVRPTRPRSRCSRATSSRPTYLRYLERRIREAFDLGPTPIKLRVRRRND